jgi:hypothetical protein
MISAQEQRLKEAHRWIQPGYCTSRLAKIELISPVFKLPPDHGLMLLTAFARARGARNEAFAAGACR